MDNALTRIRTTYESPYTQARAHRAGGGKVIGYFLNSVPEELILASGAFPVRLRGDPTVRSPLAERYMEEYMDGEVRSIFGALLEGHFDFVDLIVIPRNSEVYLQLYYFLLEMQKWEPDARTPPIYLFDLLQTPSSTTVNYVLGRIHALADRLFDVSGRRISDAGLSAAIKRTNAKRRLLKRASALWRGIEPSISGTDALAVISVAGFLGDRAYQGHIEALLAAPPPSLPQGRRILIKGSPQSDGRFTSLVERLGARVVAHDHLWGDRTFESLIDEERDPWTALAWHYCFDIPSPRQYPQAKADAAFVALAQEARVDGVVFYHDEWDDTLGWEYPDQKRMLDALGIASLFLKRQPYFDPAQHDQAVAVQSFIAELGRKP